MFRGCWNRCLLFVVRFVFVALVCVTVLVAQEADKNDVFRQNAEILKSLSGFSVPEAPPSLFSWQIGNKEIELTSSGSWELELANGGVCIGFTNGTGAEFQAPVFTQTVDFSLSLLMDKRWYFEASFADDFDKNTFAAGYHGRETDLVKEFRIGNCGLFFPDIFTFVPGSAAAEDTGTDTWGLSTTLAGNIWTAWFLTKLENTAYEEKTFSGTNEISETTITASSYVRGKWFYLPGTAGHSTTISVYVESSAGAFSGSDGRRYRKLDPAEYVLSAATGLLTLKQKCDKRVAVVSNTAQVAAPAFVATVEALFNTATTLAPAVTLTEKLYKSLSLGETGSAGAVSVTIDGNSALLVYVPGYFNPLMASSLYSAPGSYNGSSESSFNLEWAESGFAVDGMRAGAITDIFSSIALGTVSAVDSATQTVSSVGRYIEVSADGVDGSTITAEQLFPLTPYTKTAYLPSQQAATALPVVLSCNVYTEKSSLCLGNDVSPSSITVYRNAIQDTNFSFDAESGVLSLARSPAAGEHIRVTFSRTTTESSSVNLYAAAGVRWKSPKRPGLEVKSAASFLWNVSQDSYADETVSYPGSVLLSAETEYKGDNVTVGTAFAGGLSTVNATGWYRILGMDSDAYTVYHNWNHFYAVPPAVHNSILTFTADNMLAPVHRATTVTDALGKVSAYSLANAGNAPIDGATMPYPVEDSDVSGFVMALEWDDSTAYSPLTGPVWTAAEIHAEQLPDWSGSQKFELALKNPVPSAGNYDVYVQLGITDDDTIGGTGTRLGENNKTIHSWKITGSTFPAGPSEDPGVTAIFNPKASGWQTVSILLTAAERSALTAGKGIRLVAVPAKPSTTWEAGILAVGPVASHGSPFSTTTGSCVSWISADPAVGTSSSLTAHRQSSIIGRFNSESSNKVLCVSATPNGTAINSTLTRYFKRIDTDGYETLGFFLYSEKDPTVGDSVTVELGNTSGGSFVSAISMDIPLNPTVFKAATWYSVEYDIAKNTLTVNGNPYGSAITHNSTETEISQINLVIAENTGNTFYFDEWYLTGISSRPQLRNKTWFTWKQSTASVKDASGIKPFSAAYITATAEPDVSWDANDKASAATSASLESGANILGYTVSVGSVLYAGSSYAQPGFSHKLSGSTGAFRLAEDYDLNTWQNTFRHNFSTGWNGTSSVPLSFSAATAQSGSSVTQSTKTTYTAAFSSQYFTTAFNALLGETSRDGGPDDGTYGSVWLDTWRNMVIGRSGEKENRNIQIANNTGITLGDTAVKIDTTATTQYTNNSKQLTENTLDVKISIPFSINTWSITPYYQRTSLEKTPSDSYCAWKDDISQFAETPPGGAQFWQSIPFYEFVDSDFANIVENTDNVVVYRKFTASTGIQWSRPFTSTLADFFVPGAADISVGRAAISEGSGTADTMSVTAKISNTALNMFGSYGACPLFTFYTQDEFYQMYSIKTEFNSGYLNFDMSAYNAAKLLINKDNTIEADNVYSYSKAQTGTNVTTQGTTVTVQSTWKDTACVAWTHTGTASPLSALLQVLLNYIRGTNEQNTLDNTTADTTTNTFTSPYWQDIKNAPIKTIRKESLTVITGSSNDFFFSGELKHTLEAVAAYVTISADVALGFGRTSDGVTSGSIIAGIGAKIEF